MIVLIRHGETRWSLSGQHTGRTDLPLTAQGRLRAARLHDYLRAVRFDHVLTSPLQRARQTCELAGLPMAPTVESDLQEWDYGDYEGLKTAEICLRRPGWNAFEDGCPGGESVEQVAARADRLLASLLPMKGNIALFSHGQFLRVVALRWMGLPVSGGEHLALDPASISILGFERHLVSVRALCRWNSTADPALVLPASPDDAGVAAALPSPSLPAT
jgi:probable phosphoglycerate mutase